MGTYTFILNMLLIVIQFLLLGKNCTKRQTAEIMLQVPASVLFGLFIDITMSALSFFTPQGFVSSLIELIIGCFILAMGVALQVTADVVMLSGELTVKIASSRFKKEFGLMKIIFDVSLVVTAALTSLALYYFSVKQL
jgi:Predicted membrane protein